MANQAAYVAPGETVPFVNSTGSAIDLNDIVIIGALVGILSDCGMGTSGPNSSLANGSAGQARVDGVVEAPKIGSGGAVVAGQAAYWDEANNRFSPLGAGLILAGTFFEAATSAATRCKVRLNAKPSNFTITTELLAASVDKWVYVANQPCKVVAIREVHSVVGGSGAVVTPRKVTAAGTAAPGDAAGATVIELTAAAIGLETTINVSQTAGLSATAADLLLAVGDKIGLNFAGTLTGLVGSLSIELQPIAQAA